MSTIKELLLQTGHVIPLEWNSKMPRILLIEHKVFIGRKKIFKIYFQGETGQS
jgi:hypothetical protein